MVIIPQLLNSRRMYCAFSHTINREGRALEDSIPIDLSSGFNNTYLYSPGTPKYSMRQGR